MTVRELINLLLDAPMSNEVVLEVDKDTIENDNWTTQVLKVDGVANCYVHSYIISHSKFEEGGEKE